MILHSLFSQEHENRVVSLKKTFGILLKGVKKSGTAKRTRGSKGASHTADHSNEVIVCMTL